MATETFITNLINQVFPDIGIYLNDLSEAIVQYCSLDPLTKLTLQKMYENVAATMNSTAKPESATVYGYLNGLANLIHNNGGPQTKLTISEMTAYFKGQFQTGWYLKCQGDEIVSIVLDPDTSNTTYTYYALPNFASDGQVIIPSEVNGVKISRIGSSAFQNCATLRDLIISSNITSIGDFAFENCYYISSIDWTTSSSLKFTANNSVFKNAGIRTSGISVRIDGNVPEQLFNIISNKFGSRPNVVSVTLTSNCKKIGRSAFAYCDTIKSINIPSSVTLIDYAAFDNCKNISFSFATKQNNELKLGEWAFNRCSSATFNLPEGIKSIPSRCFRGTDAASSITFPASVTTLQNSIFVTGTETAVKGTIVLKCPTQVSIDPETFKGVSGHEIDNKFLLVYYGSLSYEPSNAKLSPM